MLGKSRLRDAASREGASPTDVGAGCVAREDVGFEGSSIDVMRERELQIHRMVLEQVSQGVCVFDRRQRLVLCNARYREIYGLQAADAQPGATLREILERRAAVGACSTDATDYLLLAASTQETPIPKVWDALLNDGRKVRVRHQAMPDGGWLSTHEEIFEAPPAFASLQRLMDCVPDRLWVKDAAGRYVIVNKAAAQAHGRARSDDLIGLTDFDLQEAHVAAGAQALERSVLNSGQAISGREECRVDGQGAPRWLSSTLAPLRDEGDDVVGLLGMSRDITEARLSESLCHTQAKILEMIARSAPLTSVLESLVLMIESQLDQMFASVLLLDPDGIHLRRGAAPSLAPGFTAALEGLAIGPDKGSCGAAAHRRAPVIVTDIANDPLWVRHRGLALRHGYRSCWSTPVLSHTDDVLGVFAIYAMRPRAPQNREQRLIDTATRIAGIAIERRRAEEHIRRLATHDALTGLPNRSSIHDALSHAIADAARNSRRAAALFVDLDNFKLVNDSLGHAAGDDVLKAMARRMTLRVGASGSVLRFGGDEFVVILRDLDADAERLAARVRDLHAHLAAPLPLGGRAFRVTVSMGVAIYPDDGASPEGLLAKADAAMYRAKSSGRDGFAFCR